MKKKLIWKGTLGEARKHPIYQLACEEIFNRIEELAVNEDTQSQLVLERDTFDDLKRKRRKI